MHPRQQQPGFALPADNVLLGGGQGVSDRQREPKNGGASPVLTVLTVLTLSTMGRGAWARQWDFSTTRL